MKKVKIQYWGSDPETNLTISFERTQKFFVIQIK